MNLYCICNLHVKKLAVACYHMLQENEGSQASSGEPKPSLGLEFEDLSIFEKGMDTPSPNYTSKFTLMRPNVS